MQTNAKVLGSLSIICATLIYGFFSILARFIGYTIPIYYQNITRGLVATIILAIILIATKQSWKKLTLSSFGWILMRALMGATAFLLFFFCVNFIPIGTTYFLFYGGSTVIGYLLGKLLFSERMNAVKWISLVFASVGLFFIYTINFTNTSVLYIFMALGAGAGTAFWNVSVKKLTDYSGTQLTFLDNALCVPLYLVLSLVAKETWVMPELSPLWIASLGYGLLFVVTGQLVIYGFHRLDAQIGSIIMLTEVPIAILLAFLFYHESIAPTTLFGGMLIILAILIPEWYLIQKNWSKKN